MKNLRCKCGKSTCITSMGTQDCQGCEECRTTYSWHPNYHKKLKTHEWKIKYNSNTGKPYKICNVCGQIDIESYKQAQK